MFGFNFEYVPFPTIALPLIADLFISVLYYRRGVYNYKLARRRHAYSSHLLPFLWLYADIALADYCLCDVMCVYALAPAVAVLLPACNSML
jgi:hypothetical protein